MPHPSTPKPAPALSKSALKGPLARAERLAHELARTLTELHEQPHDATRDADAAIVRAARLYLAASMAKFTATLADREAGVRLSDATLEAHRWESEAEDALFDVLDPERRWYEMYCAAYDPRRPAETKSVSEADAALGPSS